MSRLDWKRGRFDSDKYETQEIHRGIRGFQSAQVYDEIQYYRFLRTASESHDIYDEAAGEGRVYRPPVTVPCLHVTHDEGESQAGDTGFYVNDNVYVTASFDQLYRTGLTFQDVQHESYLKDRFTYDNKVFRITHIHVLGQVARGRDIVLSIEGTQIKPSELVNDQQFAAYVHEIGEEPDGDLL